jgi:MoxR-like ATPase
MSAKLKSTKSPKTAPVKAKFVPSPDQLERIKDLQLQAGVTPLERARWMSKNPGVNPIPWLESRLVGADAPSADDDDALMLAAVDDDAEVKDSGVPPLLPQLLDDAPLTLAAIYEIAQSVYEVNPDELLSVPLPSMREYVNYDVVTWHNVWAEDTKAKAKAKAKAEAKAKAKAEHETGADSGTADEEEDWLREFNPRPVPLYKPNAAVKAAIKIVKHVQGPERVMLVGPPGCGKTQAVQAFAGSVKKHIAIVDLQNFKDPREVFGETILVNGETRFELKPWVKLMMRGNCVICLDEVGRAATNVLNAFLPLLDDRGTTSVGPGIRVTVGPDVVWFATANEARAGDRDNRPVTPAFADRFTREVEVTYMSEDDECKHLISLGLNDKDARRVASFARQARELWEKGELNHPFSTRYSIDVARALRDLPGCYDEAWLTCHQRFDKTPALSGAMSPRAKAHALWVATFS